VCLWDSVPVSSCAHKILLVLVVICIRKKMSTCGSVDVVYVIRNAA
jgi:hypothetical protein